MAAAAAIAVCLPAIAIAGDPEVEFILQLAERQAPAAVVGEECLADTRGMGAEEPRAHGVQLGVVLWDELKPKLTTFSDTGYARASGAGNIQSTTLVTNGGRL